MSCLLQVVQSLRLQSSKQYSELGSCPSLGTAGGTGNVVSTANSGRPLLATRTTLNAAQDSAFVEEKVQTATGSIVVARQGDPKKPAILTYHDIGLNYLANFQVRVPCIIKQTKKSCMFYYIGFRENGRKNPLSFYTNVEKGGSTLTG